MLPLPGAPVLHLFLESLGVILAMMLYRQQRLRLRDPIDDQHRLYLLMGAAAGALLGSRLLGGIEYPDAFLNGGGAVGWTYYLRAKTIVGGLLGGLFMVEATKGIFDIRTRSGDVYVFPLLLAMIIGRVGCFSMGVLEPTYGLPTDFVLGMDLGDGIRRHPTALYEIFFLLGLAGSLQLMFRRVAMRAGRLFMLFLCAYLAYRLAVGFLQPGPRARGLTSIQWACLLGFCWYGVDEVLSWRRT